MLHLTFAKQIVIGGVAKFGDTLTMPVTLYKEQGTFMSKVAKLSLRKVPLPYLKETPFLVDLMVDSRTEKDGHWCCGVRSGAVRSARCADVHS